MPVIYTSQIRIIPEFTLAYPIQAYDDGYVCWLSCKLNTNLRQVNILNKTLRDIWTQLLCFFVWPVYKIFIMYMLHHLKNSFNQLIK